MNREELLFLPGSRIRLRPRADGAAPYLTLWDIAKLNGVGENLVKKVVVWLIADHPEHFRPGEDYVVAEDGYLITEKGQIPIATEIGSDWGWEVWREVVDAALKRGIALPGEAGRYFRK